MFIGSWNINDAITFTINTHSVLTGEQSDADSDPTYRVYEDETGTPILTGVMTKLDDAATLGFYSERIQLTAANGFEVGKSYTIRIVATVASVTGAAEKFFQLKLPGVEETVTPTPGPCDIGVLPEADLIALASTVQSITVDGQTTVNRSVADIIALDKHLANRHARCSTGGDGWGMVKKSKVVPPSAIGDV